MQLLLLLQATMWSQPLLHIHLIGGMLQLMHLTHTCDQLRTMTERVGMFMSLHRKIVETYTPAGTTDGLWIH